MKKEEVILFGVILIIFIFIISGYFLISELGKKSVVERGEVLEGEVIGPGGCKEQECQQYCMQNSIACQDWCNENPEQCHKMCETYPDVCPVLEVIESGVISEGESDKILDSSPEFESTKCSREFSPKYSTGPYYTGQLFDAHFHIPVTFDHSSIEQSTTGHIINNPSTNHKDPMLGKDFIIDEILCFFDKEDVKGSIGFFIPNPGDLDESIQEAKEIKTKSSGKINLFLMPGLLDAQILDNIQKSNPNLFRGYGELAFYSPEMSGYTPSSDKFMEIYNIADKHDLIVMIHPGQNQKSDVEKAVKNNPGVKFLLHGFEIENDITYLMDKYPNVYFSLDSATMYSMQGLFINGPKEEFVSRFKNDFNMLLERNVKKWKPAIKKHPDRFMWGTDKGDSWHFSEDISLLMEEFARAFIGRLDEEVQEKYAYQNAEKLLA